ncbi:hypothetical protein WUBG_06009 [Wuchereria bancrofti]|uniref:Uncharacterized protein n=1 Tax=Wuchereria bancrofti TaxID=6293 RepID=J9F6V4_WUCBA|nr:hypothetical protein WUBG_06009 [Wuchereria bancrofti]VDM08882.1 unnamed protein product [Wuchereria bancrofti]
MLLNNVSVVAGNKRFVSLIRKTDMKLENIKSSILTTPPPYESSLDEDPQRRNDWHCLLENQVNDTRQDGAIFQ